MCIGEWPHGFHFSFFFSFLYSLLEFIQYKHCYTLLSFFFFFFSWSYMNSADIHEYSLPTLKRAHAHLSHCCIWSRYGRAKRGNGGVNYVKSPSAWSCARLKEGDDWSFRFSTRGKRPLTILWICATPTLSHDHYRWVIKIFPPFLSLSCPLSLLILDGYICTDR